MFSGRPILVFPSAVWKRVRPHSGLLFDLLSAAHGLGSCLSGGRAVAAALPPSRPWQEFPLCVCLFAPLPSSHLCCVVDGSVWSSSVLLSQNLRSLVSPAVLILQRDISPSEIQLPSLAPGPCSKAWIHQQVVGGLHTGCWMRCLPPPVCL